MKKLLLLFILSILFANIGYSQNWIQNFKLESSDRQDGDNHGISTVISGDYVIAGAWHEDHDVILKLIRLPG